MHKSTKRQEGTCKHTHTHTHEDRNTHQKKNHACIDTLKNKIKQKTQKLAIVDATAETPTTLPISSCMHRHVKKQNKNKNKNKNKN